MLLGCELSMVNIGQLSTKLGPLSWWFPSLYARGHSALGAQVHPSITNDHQLWNLHKGYLWRSPQHTQWVNLMDILHVWNDTWGHMEVFGDWQPCEQAINMAGMSTLWIVIARCCMLSVLQSNADWWVCLEDWKNWKIIEMRTRGHSEIFMYWIVFRKYDWICMFCNFSALGSMG